MTSLRSRLFQAILLVVVICIGLTLAVGLVLTRRAVDRGALRDVSHQADLIAGSQGTGIVVTPHFKQLAPYLRQQHERSSANASILPQGAQARLKHGKSADGSVRLSGHDYFFAARHVVGAKKPFILLRPQNATTARGAPYVCGLLRPARVEGC